MVEGASIADGQSLCGRRRALPEWNFESVEHLIFPEDLSRKVAKRCRASKGLGSALPFWRELWLLQLHDPEEARS